MAMDELEYPILPNDFAMEIYLMWNFLISVCAIIDDKQENAPHTILSAFAMFAGPVFFFFLDFGVKSCRDFMAFRNFETSS